MKKVSGIILTASIADDTICNVFGYVPTGLIPVNGKPVIFHILKQFIDNHIYDVYIGVDYKKDDIKSILDTYFKNVLNINFIITDKNKGVGNSLLTIVDKIKDGNIVVNLADTYIKDLDYKNIDDKIIVSKQFTDGRRWSSLKKTDDNQILKFFNKKEIGSNNFVISGLYFLSNIDSIKNYPERSKQIEITDILEYYIKCRNQLKALETNNWMDFGHIDQYYLSKKRLIQSRNFNHLEYDDFFGTITKRSLNKDKFKDEILWYLNLPDEFKIVSPRVLDYSITSDMYLKSEYYSYPALSEIWLFSDLNDNILKSIINKLFKIINLFNSKKRDVQYSDYQSIYIEKSINRVSSIKNKKILNLITYPKIVINNIEYNNWHSIKSQIFKKVESLYQEEDNCLIHGDFCFSNILYDLRSGLFKLIDPRGLWGNTQNGDIKYDIAKLRHSLSGDYDFIMSDLYNLEYDTGREITYSIFSKNKGNIESFFDNKIKELYDLNHIKLIQGLLFISMIPLHADSEDRQVLMFCKGIESLNEVLSSP